MKKSLFFVTTTLLVVGLVVAFSSSSVMAQQSAQEQACIGAGGTWTGEECQRGGESPDIGPIFGTITNVLLFLLGAVSVIMLIVGGFRYVVSGGDSNHLQSAKNTILYAVVGLAVAIMAYAIVSYVVELF